MNGDNSIYTDSASPSRKLSAIKNNSVNLIPETSIQTLRNISDQFNRLTFVSGIVVPKDQSSEILSRKTVSHSVNNLKNIVKEDFVENEFCKLEMIKSSFNIIKNEWDEIRSKSTTNKNNLEQLESRKVDFIGNIACFQSICDNSISLLRSLEYQARIIEEYIFPYQQYTIMYYKLQNDKFSNNLKEVSSCFEIIDSSIIFFQNHTELKRTDYYVEGYKKLRVKLCCIIKNIMKNILKDCQVKRSVNESDSITDTFSQPKYDSDRENKGEYNIFLYFTQMRAKGKLFNEYIKILMQRYKETFQDETYRFTIEEMESYYINFRISDEYCGVRSFIKFGSNELSKNFRNCLTLNIKNFTRMVLNYCKYEWVTYKSFFCCEETRNNDENKIYGIQRFSRELGNKVNNSKRNGIEFNNYFSSLIEKFGSEYYNKLILHIKETQKDPELLRESIQYLSQDILNISSDLYQSVSFPDIYLSSLLHYILKLQNSLVEQLMYCTEIFIKERIQDYKLKIEELNYPEVLQSFNANKRLIRSFQSLQDSTSDTSIIQNDLSKNIPSDHLMGEMATENVAQSKCTNKNTEHQYESELLTNVSFPPSKIRLQTNSDAEDCLLDDEYFGGTQEEFEPNIGSRNVTSLNESCQKQAENAINISVGCYPVVKNSLLALSYIDHMVPNSTYLFLNKLIIKKCCDKLISAKEFICNELYLNDKISRIYHGNLFIIRNLLYLKYELINLSKWNCQKNEFEVLESNSCELDIHEDKPSNIAKITDPSNFKNNSNFLYFKTTLDSIVNIVDVLINSNLEELINNICSNISLPLTKIVLQVHPEIQSSDIKELQCTNHKYIRESTKLFWKNLEFHVNCYILKYLNLYLSIAGKEEMEALFSSIIKENGSYEGNEPLSELNSGSISTRNSNVSNLLGCEYGKSHINTIISSILPNSLSIFVSVKEVLIGIITEFDHVLNKRLGIGKNIIENELGWKLQEIINFLNSVENKLSG